MPCTAHASGPALRMTQSDIKHGFVAIQRHGKQDTDCLAPTTSSAVTIASTEMGVGDRNTGVVTTKSARCASLDYIVSFKTLG